MKWLLAVPALGLGALPAHAVELVNKDGVSHDMAIQCASTAHTPLGR